MWAAWVDSEWRELLLMTHADRPSSGCEKISKSSSALCRDHPGPLRDHGDVLLLARTPKKETP
jgi:hypothetical protein